MTICEVPLLFKDNNEAITLRDKEVVKKIPLIVRAISPENPTWETSDVKLDTPLDIPFPKEAGDFLFTYIRKYPVPDDDKTEEKNLEEYQEANEKSLNELKKILELANFMECTDFMHSIGYVVAKKLEKMSIQEIGDFFGREVNPEATMFDEADGWIHAPVEVQNQP